MAEGVLVNPPSYMTPAQFLAATPSTEFNPTSLTTPQLQAKLIAASGVANSIMRRNLLAAEQTEVFYGDGTDQLNLGTFPVVAIRQLQFIQPGISGFIIPTNRILLDMLKGQITQYSPLELQGVGFVSVFPDGLPIAITYTRGYGYNPTTPPQYTAADAPTVQGGLTPGWYTIGITTDLQWGETLPTLQSVYTASGTINCVVAPVLGAWKYRVFLWPGAMTTLSAPVAQGATSIAITATEGNAFAVGQTIVIDPMNANADPVTITAINGLTLTTTSTSLAHNTNAIVAPQTTLVSEIPATTFGGEQTQGSVSSLTPPQGYYAEPAPTTDTSMIPLPAELFEAVRLLTLDAIYRGTNFAARGLSKDNALSFVNPVGKDGLSLLYTQAKALIAPMGLSSIF